MTLLLNGTNGVSDVDGSASTPAVRGTDANTGIFFPAADTIAFAEGGAEVARFDSSGNLIVGSTSATTGDRIVNTITYDGNNGYAGSRTATVWGDSTVRASAQADGGNGQLILGTESDHRTIFITNNSERMRIDSSGNLLVGTTTAINGAKISVNQTGQTTGAFYQGDAGYASGVFVNAGSTGTRFLLAFRSTSDGSNLGSVTHNGSNVTYATSSDYRLKEDILPMTGALEVVGQLKPCTYTWKADGSEGQGFIAHELQAVVPDAVVGEKDAVDAEGNPQYQGIDTSFLVATLTAAIQEQQAIITDLKSRIEALEQA